MWVVQQPKPLYIEGHQNDQTPSSLEIVLNTYWSLLRLSEYHWDDTIIAAFCLRILFQHSILTYNTLHFLFSCRDFSVARIFSWFYRAPSLRTIVMAAKQVVDWCLRGFSEIGQSERPIFLDQGTVVNLLLEKIWFWSAVFWTDWATRFRKVLQRRMRTLWDRSERNVGSGTFG